MTRSEGGNCHLRCYEEIILRVQHSHSAAEIFSSLLKSPIVQSRQPKARFGEIEQRCIDQCAMVACQWKPRRAPAQPTTGVA